MATSTAGSTNSQLFDDIDEIDPRVQIELEQLNTATDAINRLEVELDDARSAFRQLLTDSSQRINLLAKKLGNCVERSRPYYEARVKAKEAQLETQKAALRFERANSAHSTAKEMVFLAEEGLQKEGRTFDPAWQEMLNHATMRVNEAETERNISEQEHRKKSKTYNEVEQLVQVLQKDLKKAIAKSRPYFEMKAQFNQIMEEQKRRVHALEECVLKAKQSYADALYNLEEISDEIHNRRKMKEAQRELGVRGVGVGAESPETECSDKCATEPKEVTCGEPSSKVYPTSLPTGFRIPRSLSSSTVSSVLSLNNNASTNVPLTPTDYSSKTLCMRKSMSIEARHRQEIQDLIEKFNYSGGIKQFPIPTLKKPIKQTTFNEELACAQLNQQQQKLKDATISPNYLAALAQDDCDTSDVESLSSIDVLTDEQVANLMLDEQLTSLQDLFFEDDNINIPSLNPEEQMIP